MVGLAVTLTDFPFRHAHGARRAENACPLYSTTTGTMLAGVQKAYQYADDIEESASLCSNRIISIACLPTALNSIKYEVEE